MHSNEGVNLQIYNRCIGTRYCANNCPYKVRRFNWYEYASFRAGPQNSENPLTRATKNITTSGTMHPEAELAHAPLQMMFNPDVTVRSKGVMEKCTFCVQRTREVRDLAKRSGAKVKDGTVTSACAQTCPTQAITFGDLNDPFSAVVQNAKAAEAEGLAYGLLDVELNTRPAVTYFKRLRHRPEAAAGHDHAAPAQGGAHS
jgi:molybdopterin-containing oxidoreductase family iron-sulfur binding subunit